MIIQYSKSEISQSSNNKYINFKPVITDDNKFKLKVCTDETLTFNHGDCKYVRLGIILHNTSDKK